MAQLRAYMLMRDIYVEPPKPSKKELKKKAKKEEKKTGSIIIVFRMQNQVQACFLLTAVQ